MEDNRYLKVVNNDGVEIDYEILTTFYLKETGKNYVIYTDIESDSEMDVNVYAAIYDLDGDCMLEEITTDMEWNYVEEILASFQGDE